MRTVTRHISGYGNLSLIQSEGLSFPVNKKGSPLAALIVMLFRELFFEQLGIVRQAVYYNF